MAITPTANIPAHNTVENKTDLRAMSIATALFFMWGFLTSLNDILIPHLKGVFELSYAQAMLIQFAFFSSYFIFALPAGKLVEWRGYKQSMVFGLIVMAAGALLFLPASALPLLTCFWLRSSFWLPASPVFRSQPIPTSPVLAQRRRLQTG